MKIQVSTGRLSRRVIANSIDEAFQVFLDKYHPQSLGVLASFKSKDLDDVYYVSVENWLRKRGKMEDQHV